MRRVVLAKNARNFLLREAAYLRVYSQNASRQFKRRMSDARKRISRFPEIGFERDGPPIPGTRRLVVDSYLLDYSLGEEIIITAIRHGRQRDPEAQPMSEDD